MPELPEVQTIVEDLKQAGLTGRMITKAAVFWERTIAYGSSHDFCRRIQDHCIQGLYRRAKYIVFEMDGGLFLIVHLRMTGGFELATDKKSPGLHTHVVLYLDNQRCLMFHDTRKFGRFYLTRTPGSLLGSLGPEPLEKAFTARLLAGCLEGRRRQIKPLLLDQRFIAGLGNIYVDEALWRARIHPIRLSHTLTKGEVIALHRAIRFVLRLGMRHGGTTLGNGLGNFKSARRGRGRNAVNLNVFRRTGMPCPRCREPIEKIIVGQRSTHFCAVCQLSAQQL